MLGAMHRKKMFTSFPSPAGMSLTKLPLGSNYSVMTSLFPPRETLVVTFLAKAINRFNLILPLGQVFVQRWLDIIDKIQSISSIHHYRPHRKKRFVSFPSPAGMSLTKLPLGRNNSVMKSLFPPRESLVVTSRLGTGNSRTFFTVYLRRSHRCCFNYGVYKRQETIN
jgi:hypothetical protein